MDDLIIRELGGGAAAVLVALLVAGYGVMALVIRSLWVTINSLQTKLFDYQTTNNKEVRELQLSTNAALGALTASLQALSATLNERRRNE